MDLLTDKKHRIMSRAKAKLAVVVDMQCKQPDFVLTKRDCDMIANALVDKYGYKARQIHYHFKSLGRL